MSCVNTIIILWCKPIPYILNITIVEVKIGRDPRDPTLGEVGDISVSVYILTRVDIESTNGKESMMK